jgi:hypothetical protein
MSLRLFRAIWRRITLAGFGGICNCRFCRELSGTAGATLLSADPVTGVKFASSLSLHERGISVPTEVCVDISSAQTCVDISFIEDNFKTVEYDGIFGLETLYILTSFLASG